MSSSHLVLWIASLPWMVLLQLPTPAAERPNVLFIAIDDLNDWVGCLGGHPQASTPNIDRLSKRGMLFANAHCAAPLCNPSRTAVMTGMLPSSTGVHGNEQDWHKSPFLEGHSTLPRWFHDHGYHTAACGKLFHANHGGEVGAPNGGHGGLAGFDDFPAWDERFPAKDRQLVRDALLPGQNLNGLDIWHWDWGPMDASDDETTDGRAVAWASEQLAKRYDKPFFLAVGIYRPHGPWYVPRTYFDTQPPLDEIVLPESPADDLDDVPAVAKNWQKRAGDYHPRLLAQGLWDDAVRAYLANVAFADAMVGRVLDALETSPHAANTIVVLWSDHGWHLGEKQRWHKSTLWEEATRVPLIVAAPGVTEPGSRCERAVSLIDLYPTLCELTGLPAPERLDGTSLVPLLRDSEAKGHPPAVTILGGRHAAVRSDRWRLIRYATGDEELYDHESDPNERTNLASSPKFAAVRSDLAKHLPQEIRRYAEDHEFPNEPGFRPIFNGEDLTGWNGDEQTWRVADGAIVGRAGIGSSARPLVWKASRLRNFELRLRFRTSEGGFLIIRYERGGTKFSSSPGQRDGEWRDVVFKHQDGVSTLAVDGQPPSSGKTLRPENELGTLSFGVPEAGQVEIKNIRLRDIGGP